MDYNLNTLNDLRHRLGRPPMKSWRGSKANLKLIIDHLVERIGELDEQERQAELAARAVVVEPTHPVLTKGAKRRAKIDKAADKLLQQRARDEIAQSMAKVKQARAKRTATTPTPEGNTFKLADLAREHDIDARIARAKMRKAGHPGPHVYASSQRAEILAVIK